jgi:3-isopropylmalate dehydrogenase
MPAPVTNDDLAHIVLLPGDGIGREIAVAAARLLEEVGGIVIETQLMGGCSIDEHGEPLTDHVLDRCKESDGVLLGAVGGPKWDSTDPKARRPEEGLLRLRRELGRGEGLYANLRPVKPYDALLSASPLREERIRGTDLLIVRELTGGSYYGRRERVGDKAYDTCEYSVGEIERVAVVAFEAALERSEQKARPAKLTSVDKANVLETSRLWREVVTGVAGKFPDVQVEHILVDNAAMQLVDRPADFDVILTENTFGDILSDQAAMLTGSLGMLPSASIDHFPPGLFEPIHGSAPNIAGQGVANPLAMLLSIALMFHHGLGRFDNASEVGSAIEAAVAQVLDEGFRTPDIVVDRDSGDEIRRVGTEEMTDAVIAALELPDDHWFEGAMPLDRYQEQLSRQKKQELQPA